MWAKRTVWLMVLVMVLGILPVKAQSDEQLSAAYGTSEGGLSFSYPADWVLLDYWAGEVVALASSQRALDAELDDDPIPIDDVYLTIWGPLALDDYTPVELRDLSLEEALLELVEVMDDAETESQLGEMVSTQVADHPALMVPYSTTDTYEEGVRFVVDVDGAYVLVSTKAWTDTYAEHDAVVRAILDTLSYAPIEYTPAPVLELTEQYTSADQSLTLSFPAGWVALEPAAGGLYVSNDRSALEAFVTGANPVFPMMLMILPPPETARMFPGAADMPLKQAFDDIVAVRDLDVYSVETVTVAGQPAVVAYRGGGSIALIDFGGDYVLVMTVDDLGLYEAQLRAVLDSLAFSPPAAVPALGALTEQYVSPTGTLSINYPADWASGELRPNALALSNDPAALAAYQRGEADFPPVAIYIIDPLEAEYAFVYYGEATSPEEALAVVAERLDFTPEEDAIESLTIAGRPAVVTHHGRTDLMIIDFDGAYAFVMTLDDWGQYAAHVRAILDTLDYQPLEVGAGLAPRLLFSAAYQDGGVSGAVWNRTETQVLSWGTDGTARIWDVATHELRFMAEHDTRVSGAAWNATETLLLT